MARTTTILESYAGPTDGGEGLRRSDGVTTSCHRASGRRISMLNAVSITSKVLEASLQALESMYGGHAGPLPGRD